MPPDGFAWLGFSESAIVAGLLKRGLREVGRKLFFSENYSIFSNSF
jgi:hypothetical protein